MENLTFKVTRSEPEMVKPAAPTPCELKTLSDMDHYRGVRFHILAIRFYASPDPSMVGRDPVQVIREGLSKALVYYYPYAGRLKELSPGNKLAVDCTGEGVVFIEADADVSLDQFGEPLRPPFPFLKEFLFDVPGTAGILDSPLLLIQVTRLKCGGFVFAHRVNHVMSDLAGMVQFLKAIADLGKGAAAPSVLPVWRRELLEARKPPLVTCEHNDMPNPKGTILPFTGMTHRSYSFYHSEISSIRLRLPPHLRNKCSTFDILAVCLWWCRTAALRFDPEEQVRLWFSVEIRDRLNPPLPVGYYGNAFAFMAADTTARELCGEPLEFTLDLVRKAKAKVTEEYVRSFVDNIVAAGKKLPVTDIRIFTVSDGTRGGSQGVNFGWGKAKYAGPATGVASFFVPTRKKGGEVGICVPVGLPAVAIKRFEEELNVMLGKEANRSKLVRSPL